MYISLRFTIFFLSVHLIPICLAFINHLNIFAYATVIKFKFLASWTVPARSACRLNALVMAALNRAEQHCPSALHPLGIQMINEHRLRRQAVAAKTWVKFKLISQQYYYIYILLSESALYMYMDAKNPHSS